MCKNYFDAFEFRFDSTIIENRYLRPKLSFEEEIKMSEEGKIRIVNLSAEINPIQVTHTNVYFLRKIVILRREMRFIRVEIFIYTMRMILLIASLKLVGH